MKRQFLLCVLLFMFFCAGCSQSLPPAKPTVHVGGKVVFANGDPVKCAFLVLEPKDAEKCVSATGWTDKNGKFNLRSYSVEEPDGAVKGAYMVRLEPYDPGTGVKLPKGVTPSVIPDRYKKTSTSDLTIEVEDETTDLVFKLK